MPDEIHQKHIRQDVPGLRKRWFQGEHCDLAIWQDKGGAVVHFQLQLDGDLIIDYESGRGMITGSVDTSRGSGHFPASATIRSDNGLNKATLQFAFREFVEFPPLSQKRVLQFVAEALNAALSDPEKPRFADGTLPPGQDSALMDVVSIARSVEYMKEAKQRESMIQRLMSRFLGSKA